MRPSLKGKEEDNVILNLVNALRYYSSDRNVATVSATGKIRARGAGSCRIYVLANNGVCTSIKVQVR